MRRPDTSEVRAFGPGCGPAADAIAFERGWGSDRDLARAEQRAWTEITEHTAAAGGDAILGVTMEVVPWARTGVFRGGASWLVLLTGTSCRLRAGDAAPD